MPDNRWTQLPDGPWVLPDLESGIYIRQVQKRERYRRPPQYTVTGPGYDTTEHPSLDEAMEAAEAERYPPFMTQVNPGWPPMPEIITAWPLELFVRESVWPYWLGSSAEIAGFVRRAEEWMNWHFHRFEKLPRDAWYIRPGTLRQQQSITFNYTVGAPGVALGASSPDGLRDEIQARRGAVTTLILLMSATDRTWLGDEIFDRVPLKPIPPPTPAPPGVSFSSYTTAVPNRVELYFEQEVPAVRLRTIAAHPRVCEQLHETLRPYIDASRRKERVWNSGATGGVAAIIGCAIPAVLLLAGTITPAPTMLLQLVLAPLGMLVGLRVIEWAFPPFEIVETWQRSRWQRTKTVFWQGVLFVLALSGVILTVLLSQPSGSSTAPRRSSTTPSAQQSRP